MQSNDPVKIIVAILKALIFIALSPIILPVYIFWKIFEGAARAGAEDAERMRQGLPPKNAWMGDNHFKKK